MAKGSYNSAGRLPSAAASTNATLLSSEPVDVYYVIALNTSATIKYLKLYNKKTVPVPGTDAPFMTIALPPSNAQTTIHLTRGCYFTQGLGFAVTGAAADNDATALTAGDVVGVNILYI